MLRADAEKHVGDPRFQSLPVEVSLRCSVALLNTPVFCAHICSVVQGQCDAITMG